MKVYSTHTTYYMYLYMALYSSSCHVVDIAIKRTFLWSGHLPTTASHSDHPQGSHLVLPLKLHPHLAELLISAAGRVNIVHNVDMNVVENNTVPVTRGTGYVVHWGGWGARYRFPGHALQVTNSRDLEKIM